MARNLERAWEEKLQAERALQEAYHRERHQQPRHLTEDERETIRELATQLPALWTAPTTTPADRKEVLRLLIDRIVVTVDKETEYVDITAHWSGGHETQTRMRRPVARLAALSRHDELLDEIRRLRGEGYSAPEIAETLNRDGWVTPTQRSPFNERLIRAMVYRYGSPPKGPRRFLSDDPNEWSLAELAGKLEMPIVTLYGWLRRGWLQTRWVRGQHAVIADPPELERLRKLRRQHSASRGHKKGARAPRSANRKKKS